MVQDLARAAGLGAGGRLAILGALALAGCTGSNGSDDTTPTTTTTTGGGPVFTDTGWPPGDVGAFQIYHDDVKGKTGVFAVATAAATNVANPAECAAMQNTCYPRFDGMDDDTFTTFDPDYTLDRTANTTRYLGYTITIGPYSLDYKEDPKTGFGYYSTDVSAQKYKPGWDSVTWGGQWPEYKGSKKGDLYAVEPLQLLTPADSQFVFTDNSTQVIEWVPTGEGVMTLAVIPKFGDGTFYRLHDDGYFELPANDLGLTTNEVNDLTLKLTRWYPIEDSHFGEIADYLSTSEITFQGELVNIGDREKVKEPNRCAEAQGSLPLEAGSYWGSNLGYTNELDPQRKFVDGCLADAIINPYADSKGNESIARLEVGPHHQIGVSYNMPDLSAAVYFVTDCNNKNTCFNGSDLDSTANVPEYISYFNPDQDTKTIYLVLDSTDNKGPDSLWTLDLTDTELGPPPMEDACSAAEAASPASPGAYYTDFVGSYTGDLNPGTGGCTGSSVPGPEAIMTIDIPPYGTLNASVNMPGGDPALYLLYDCTQAFTCAAGSDASLDATEAVVHQNTSLYPQRVYLVVDSKTGLLPFFLSFNY